MTSVVTAARSRLAAAGGRSSEEQEQTRPHQAGRVVLAAVGLAALTGAMALLGTRLDVDNVLLLYLLGVVVIAIAAGRVAALVAAVASYLLARARMITSPAPDQ